jgi:RNA polymerase sigma-B factor
VYRADGDADFFAYQRTRDRDLRNKLVERHLGIAHHLAHRYRHRGVADDDLVQVATIGLLKSVERFDPDRGTSFGAFATPTILGELRRHFRDATWAMRVPRQLQERVLAVGRVFGPLTQQHGRSPNADEIGRAADMSVEEVLEALEADSAYGTSPLDPTSDPGYRLDKTAALADDPEHGPAELVEQRLLAETLVAQLTDRERYIVELRFVGGLTQSQIADRIGVSQMHVSRLLTCSIEKMRAHLHRDEEPA